MTEAQALVALLAQGKAAKFEDANESAVENAYTELVAYLKDQYPLIDVDRFGESSQSDYQRIAAEGDLSAVGADRDPELLSVADRLAVAMEQVTTREISTRGLDPQTLEAIRLGLHDRFDARGQISLSGFVRDSGSFRISNYSSDNSTGDRTAGIEPVEPWPEPWESKNNGQK
jgi:hypothetical protein